MDISLKGCNPVLTIPLRKQGGATIVTLPSSLLKGLKIKAGDEVAVDVRDRQIVLTPVAPARRRRYTLAELLVGVTPRVAKGLADATAESRKGPPVGREIA